jgi:acetoacetyl-CoA synthetase
MVTSEMPRKLWEHPDPNSTQMYDFMQEANGTYGLNLKVCLVPSVCDIC